MSRRLHTITLRIQLRSPYLVHGTDPGRFGLDATQFIDHLGRPVLPGTLVAGRVAEIWRDHHAALGGASPGTWFGSEGIDDGSGQHRARLLVRDLVLQTPHHRAESHGMDASRIRQDDDTGAVRTGHLLLIEQFNLPGQLLDFQGDWLAWADSGEIDTLVNQLRAALLLQTQLGAYRGVGFGRTRLVTVSAAPATLGAPWSVPQAIARQRFALQTDAVLCVGASTLKGNVFSSADYISGGQIKGALARLLLLQTGAPSLGALHTTSLLARHFDALRVTHALPAAPAGGRPMPLPLSLVSHRGHVWDAALLASPPAGLDEAPAFIVDWKAATYAQAGATQGWPALRRHLRVRTAIQQGRALDEKLFAVEGITCLQDDGQPAARWLFDIDLSAVPAADHAAMWAELASCVAGGLGPLGKTDAVVQVAPLPAGDAGQADCWPSANPTSPGTVQPAKPMVLCLVSDALLLPTTAAAASPNQLLVAYQAAFDALLALANAAGCLQLTHHFARQHLAGGEYLQRRFMSARPYQPLMLTYAGSVFVFRVADEAAATQVLMRWQQQGLPLPPAVAEAHGHSWKHQTYLPQHGYGEVALHPAHGFAPLTHSAAA